MTGRTFGASRASVVRAGLRDRTRLGRLPALMAAQLAELREVAIRGPDVAQAGSARWRCVDLLDIMASRWDVTVHERIVGNMLRRLGLTAQQQAMQPQKFGKGPAAEEGVASSVVAPLVGIGGRVSAYYRAKSTRWPG